MVAGSTDMPTLLIRDQRSDTVRSARFLANDPSPGSTQGVDFSSLGEAVRRWQVAHSLLPAGVEFSQSGGRIPPSTMQFRPTFGPRGGPIGCGTGRAGPVLQCGRLLDRDKSGRHERPRDGRPAAPAIAMRGSRFTVWLLVTGFCLLGAMVPPATAAPKSVLVLSEGPVLPYTPPPHRQHCCGSAPRQLRAVEHLSGIDRPNPIQQRRIRAAARRPVQLQVRRCGGARPHHHDHRASTRLRPPSSRGALSERGDTVRSRGRAYDSRARYRRKRHRGVPPL